MAIYQVTVSGLVSSNTFNNVLHFIDDRGGPNPEQVLANDVDSVWIDQVKGFQHNQVNYLQINVRNVGAPGPAPFNKTINKLGTGGPTTAADIPTIAIVLRFQTAVAGRTGRGRVHLAGPRQATSANLGILTTATITAWQTQLNAISAAMLQGGSLGIALAICSRSNPSGTVKSVTSLQLRAILGTMRSRNWGVGI
jgi:hypothetical protein